MGAGAHGYWEKVLMKYHFIASITSQGKPLSLMSPAVTFKKKLSFSRIRKHMKHLAAFMCTCCQFSHLNLSLEILLLGNIWPNRGVVNIPLEITVK